MEISLVEWGDLLPGAQMDDVVLEIGLASTFEAPWRLSGRGVTVAVLDSGVDASHPFLNVADAVSTCPESSESQDGMGRTAPESSPRGAVSIPASRQASAF